MISDVSTQRKPGRIGCRPVIFLGMIAILSGLCGLSVQAAEESTGVTVIKNVTLIDGTGSEPLAGQDLHIQNQKILAIQPTGGQIPADAVVVDGHGKTVIPGLISAHSHVGQVDGISRVPANYNRENIIRQLQQYSAYGVTTVVALGTNQPLFYELRKDAHAGTIPGADLFGADRGIGVRGGAPSAQVLPSAADFIDRPQTAAEARAAVQAAKQRGTDLIKMWVDDSRGTVPKMSAEVYTAVIDEAHKQGIRVTAHIFNLADAKALVAAGIDVIAHGVRDQPVDREFVEAMKENSVWYIPTLALDDATFIYADRPEWITSSFFLNSLQPALRNQLEDPKWQQETLARPNLKLSREALKMNQRNLAILQDAGVKIGFGTDSGAMPLRIPGFAEHRELMLMHQVGFTPLEAITVATGKTAELLKLTDRGTLKPGQRADFVILNANPAEKIENVQQIDSVWQRGKQTSGAIAER